MSAVLESNQPERREVPDRRQPFSPSRMPWTATVHGNFAVVADKYRMPVANLHVFEGSEAHGRMAENVKLILAAVNAHRDFVALTRELMPQLRAAAESDSRAGLAQSDNIRRYQLARDALVAAGRSV